MCLYKYQLWFHSRLPRYVAFLQLPKGLELLFRRLQCLWCQPRVVKYAIGTSSNPHTVVALTRSSRCSQPWKPHVWGKHHPTILRFSPFQETSKHRFRCFFQMKTLQKCLKCLKTLQSLWLWPFQATKPSTNPTDTLNRRPAFLPLIGSSKSLRNLIAQPGLCRVNWGSNHQQPGYSLHKFIIICRCPKMRLPLNSV